MRVTNFQLYEIVGDEMAFRDYAARALSLYSSDNPSFEMAVKKYCISDMKMAKNVLDIFSGDCLKKLPEFRRYLKLVVSKMRTNAMEGSSRDVGAKCAERFMEVMDKIISGEWTWVYIAPKAEPVSDMNTL